MSKLSAAATLAATLDKVIGGNSDVQTVNNWLDTGYPPFNQILGGGVDTGVPFGRIIEIFGPSSSGKTALATMMMIEAQRKGGIAMFNDHENTFDLRLAKGMGLSDEYPFWVYKRPDTWEESNTNAMKAAEAIRASKVIPPEAPIVIVFDSVASMIPKSVFEKGIDEYTMNDTTALARVTSTTLKAVNNYCSKFNVTLIYLNQIRTKPGVVYGDPTTTPGGQAMEFYATTRLSLGRTKIMEDQGGGKKEMTGQIITVKTVKNKLTRPFQEVDLVMNFNDAGGIEFDPIASAVELLIEKGKIPYSKPRATWDGKQLFKKQLIQYIKDNNQKDELFKLMLD
ncbi:hypothetical protein [Methylobacillus sp.]|uniref:hypothetical protein n=1 Tax=Methylobacillus sp. TaxID=56818 RepID=UPI0012D08B92|nr:hypothetical protein [Methylobacillus sp.]MPS48477.1 recombinase [Methylobacillus sp.]